jgi:hypothetical protein
MIKVMLRACVQVPLLLSEREKLHPFNGCTALGLRSSASVSGRPGLAVVDQWVVRDLLLVRLQTLPPTIAASMQSGRRSACVKSVDWVYKGP